MDFNINNYLSNLSQINKDFNSIWEEILTTVPKLTDKWVPGEANESDPLVVLLKELGIISDKLNYNIDKNILENFPDLLTQLRTAYSVFKSMGYNPSWYKSAITKITITYNGGVGDDILSSAVTNQNQKFDLPLFTTVSDENNENIFTLIQKGNFIAGEQKRVTLLAIEGTPNDFEVNGDRQIKINNLDSQNKLYFVQPNVAQNGVFIDFDPEFNNIDLWLTGSDQIEQKESTSQQENKSWKRVDNLYQQLPGSYVYKFGIDPGTGTNYIQFPDDIGTLIDKGIYIKYILSSGTSGNIKANTITQLYADPDKSIDYGTEEGKTATLTKSNFTVRNLASTQNGSDPETIEEMQHNYERVVGTFDTLVTLRDYNNYIYNATDDAGRNIVSNIKVSDRGDDLYDHLTYKTLDASGVFTTKSVVIPDSKSEIKTEGMKAFDLRLYPLKNTDTGDINNWNDFNQTFDAGVTNNAGVLTDDPWITQITSSIEYVKAINHDFEKTCGVPVFIDYDVKGQIYLQKVVSIFEALEVQQAVDLAVYRNFNSRELYFGESINYPKLVETIKNSDPRIQYVAIDPIEYRDPDLTVFNNLSNQYDVTVRSILNGSTPWAVHFDGNNADSTGFSDFIFHYGQNNTQFYGVDGDEGVGLITSISPQIKKPENGDITVKKNETFSILVPSYITQTTYSNYLYAGVDKVKLESGSPVKLGQGQYVNIYDTKRDTKPRYTLGEGDIVVFNGDESNNVLDVSNPDWLSLGTKLSISVLTPDTTILNNSRLLSGIDISDRGNYKLKVASNSSGLTDYLTQDPPDNPNDDDGYTLNIGEYLLFADYVNDPNSDGSNTPVLEVGIIGEGNTIVNISGKPLLTEDDRENFIISTANINAGNFNNTAFVIIDSGALEYTANTIYNFGEGYTLKGISIPNYKPTQVFPIEVVPQNTVVDFTNGAGENLELQSGTTASPLKAGGLEITNFDNSNGDQGFATLKLSTISENSLNINIYNSNGFPINFTIGDKTEMIPNWSNKQINFEKTQDSLVLKVSTIDGSSLTANNTLTLSSIDTTGTGSIDYYLGGELVGSIPKTVDNTGYKMSCQLSLLLTPNNEQTLKEGQQVVLNDGKETTTTIDNSLTIQANSTLIYTGGQPLELSETESSTLRLMVSLKSELKEGEVWTPIGIGLKLPIMGTDESIVAFLCAYEDNSNNIGYILSKPGETITSTNPTLEEGKEISSLSTRLLGIKAGSKYYKKEGGWSAIDNKGIISSTPTILKTEDGLLYYDGYSPIYTQSDNVILNPESATNYFLSNHPCNSYVLPRLRGEGGKEPLQKLEISKLSIRS